MKLHSIVAGFAAFSLFVVNCSQKKEKEQKTPAKAETSATQAAGGPANQQSGEQAKEAALKAIDGWLDAQKNGDFDRYMAFYDAKFQGVRRSGGKEQPLDLEGWRTDREKQVKGKPTVVAEGRSATTWVDKPELGEGVVEVRFTQRYKASTGYADHGPKVVRLRVSGGKALFIYEDMLSSTKGWGSGSPSAAKTDFSAWKFVRTKPPHDKKAGVDSCAYTGGIGMACIDAYKKETDAVKKRFMRLLTDADARFAQDDLAKGQPGGVAHAEVSMNCNASGPCQPDKDDGYSCLTKAEMAHQEGKAAEAKAAHQRACECDAKGAALPVMGGQLACEGSKPVNRGKVLTTAEAKAVRACATCDPQAGPEGCAQVIDKLASSDQALATYIEQTHVPRCQQP